MRIAIVGPAHPHKGGVAQYTTQLAHQLAAGGHEVVIETWSHQYPKLLYPGQLTVTEPELPLFSPTRHDLSWRRPDSWFRVGRRLRTYDLVVLVVVTPIQMPAYRGVLRGLGGAKRTAKVVAECHNVLPHERRAVDVALMKGVLGRLDGVLVHSDEQAATARELSDRPVVTAHMAPMLIATSDSAPRVEEQHDRLLFFGLVRPYKGLDVLLRAIAASGLDTLRLRVAGEFWGGPESTVALISELGLTGRVELRPGYVDSKDVPGLFADVDALALPYRSATASFNAFLAFEHGVPVIATKVGTIEGDVRDGVDAVLCEPDDVPSLTAALQTFYASGAPAKLRAGVPAVDPTPKWDAYTAALIEVAGS